MTVGVLSDPVVIVASNTPSLPVTLQFVGSELTFSVPSVVLGPTTATGLFRFTAQFVGSGSISIVVSGLGASQFVRTIWTTFNVFSSASKLQTICTYSCVLTI